MEVNRVLLEQIRPHDHTNVDQGKEVFVILVDGHQRGWDIAVHHTYIHDWAWINVSIQTWRSAGP